MATTINETLSYLAALPPWVDKVGAILGILAFLFAATAFIWKSGRQFIDWISSFNKTWAQQRAGKTYDHLKKYILATKHPSLMVLFALSEVFKFIFEFTSLIFILLISLYFLQSNNVLHIKDINTQLTTLQTTIIFMEILLGASFTCRFKLNKLTHRQEHIRKLKSRIDKLLTRAGMDDETIESWIQERGGLPKIPDRHPIGCHCHDQGPGIS